MQVREQKTGKLRTVRLTPATLGEAEKYTTMEGIEGKLFDVSRLAKHIKAGARAGARAYRSALIPKDIRKGVFYQAWVNCDAKGADA